MYMSCVVSRITVLGSCDLDEYARCLGLPNSSMRHPCMMCCAPGGELLSDSLHDMSWRLRTQADFIRNAGLRCRVVHIASTQQLRDINANSACKYKQAGRVMLKDAGGLQAQRINEGPNGSSLIRRRRRRRRRRRGPSPPPTASARGPLPAAPRTRGAPTSQQRPSR